MQPFNPLEPDERECCHYLKKIWKQEFENTYIMYKFNGVLDQEIVELFSMCSFLFDEFGFPDQEHLLLLDRALIDTIRKYLNVFPGVRGW